MKGYSHSFRITWDKTALILLESRKQRYIKAINKLLQARRMFRVNHTITHQITVPLYLKPHTCVLFLYRPSPEIFRSRTCILYAYNPDIFRGDDMLQTSQLPW